MLFLIEAIVCIIALVAKLLVEELDACFLAHHVINALGILYQQYWCQPTIEEMFDKYLCTFMDAYEYNMILGEGDKKLLIPPLINHKVLMLQ